MLESYLPILFFIVVVGAFAVGNLVLAEFLGKRFPARGKSLPYECGMQPEEQANTRFSIQYYKTAVLFILFDIEVIFLIPWALNAKSLGTDTFLAMVGFLGSLLIGFVYIWKKGALEWEL